MSIQRHERRTDPRYLYDRCPRCGARRKPQVMDGVRCWRCLRSLRKSHARIVSGLLPYSRLRGATGRNEPVSVGAADR